MKINESERLRNLTNDWKLNTLFLEPPEKAHVQMQILGTTLTRKNIMGLILIIKYLIFES